MFLGDMKTQEIETALVDSKDKRILSVTTKIGQLFHGLRLIASEMLPRDYDSIYVHTEKGLLYVNTNAEFISKKTRKILEDLGWVVFNECISFPVGEE